MNKGKLTRLNILQKAFELSYQKGYQATSVDDIIHFTTVTKGSFFYHFKNKEEMGLAMINEVMLPGMRKSFIEPLKDGDTSKRVIIKMMRYILLEDPNFDTRYGCPAVNIIEEMAPINQRFSKAITNLTDEVLSKIEEVVDLGVERGEMNKDVNSKQVANFVMSGYMGVRTLGKLYGTKSYDIYLKELKKYLDSL
ncbi:TetR/AcrR family transcriptional regulator [Flagellimonas sp. S174]|uniref:TetR/AcrR family transcriptional regulator n=1 Tax=Flagellimonas sp. S174 TaxID=3410790 RepID=UPI003BF579F0